MRSPECYFGDYFPRFFEAQHHNTQMIHLWAHTSHILFYFFIVYLAPFTNMVWLFVLDGLVITRIVLFQM